MRPLRSNCLALVLALAAAPASAGIPPYHPPFPTETILAQRSIADTSTVRATNPAPPAASAGTDSSAGPHSTAAPDSASAGSTRASTAAKTSSRTYGQSMGKAVLFDALIPGSGHLYAGYKSGWINLGIEGLTWAAYFYYHGQGVQEENEYIAFADSNWSYDAWINSGCPECYPGSPEDELIRKFMAENRQHYYEDIGKLSTYFEGWNDYNGSSGSSANRETYRAMRNESNKDLKNGEYALMVGLINRVVAVADIIRLFKKSPKIKLGNDTNLQFKLHTKPFSPDNAFGIRVTKNL